MKPAMSTLNPYAASYIPLSKREAADKSDVAGWTTKSSQYGSQTAWYGAAEHASQSRQHDKAPSASGVSALKSQSALGFYGSSSQNPDEVAEKQAVEGDFETDLEYLRISFPGISDESLVDVYMANKGDLESALDMLSQLEFDSPESSEYLPDSLDIGDVSESVSAAECSSVKLKNVVGEGSASAGSSASDSVIVN
ncbi:hypothetical protein Tsubulata_034737 [Turnera subulata]|uniref:CUE domain-containing protein n=1 Tax=Turnera subulata TaxID=218843 RepID=A0A9Q0JMK9_9ROSI|nr:hypothetical protein Tsubulata_034737 [Turnera subulata]